MQERAATVKCVQCSCSKAPAVLDVRHLFATHKEILETAEEASAKVRTCDPGGGVGWVGGQLRRRKATRAPFPLLVQTVKRYHLLVRLRLRLPLPPYRGFHATTLVKILLNLIRFI
jgi:hypothetical protein